MQCISPTSIKDPLGTTNAQRIIVDCGKCGACLHNRRVDWSFRLAQEMRSAISGWFITLTYDPEHVPIKNGIQTLNKRHVQLFCKRVRKEHTRMNESGSDWLKMPQMRYYAIGEYGSKTGRPHYHLLMFNLQYDLAAKLDRYWSVGKQRSNSQIKGSNKRGQIKMGAITSATIHYCTKHHVNTRKGEEVLDQETGELVDLDTIRQGEFALMSRRPGIGFDYVEKNREWHESDSRRYVMNNGYRQRLPRYYANKLKLGRMSQEEVDKIQREKDRLLNHELERLRQHKIQNPDAYLERCLYLESLKVMKDAKNNQFL